MKYHFCTLFDRNYLYKGLALYNSLLKHCPDFVLWILCMDDITHAMLTNMGLKNAQLIRLHDFEDEELLRAKRSRTVAEYCWTCTPSLLLYVLKNDPSADMVAYLDADLFFFSSPSPIYEEFGDNSIMIIEHRFPEHLRHMEENGIYNVQMLIFRNNAPGMECLKWWRDRCNEWCYFRLEDGKMGDQKYLDDWPVRFEGVHVLQHKGAGVALWNIMRYRTNEKHGKVHIDDDPLIFYHFHQFDILRSGSYDYGAREHYSLTSEDIKYIYLPYVKAIEHAIGQVRSVDPLFNYGLTYIKRGSLISRILRIPKKTKDTFAWLRSTSEKN